MKRSIFRELLGQWKALCMRKWDDYLYPGRQRWIKQFGDERFYSETVSGMTAPRDPFTARELKDRYSRVRPSKPTCSARLTHMSRNCLSWMPTATLRASALASEQYIDAKLDDLARNTLLPRMDLRTLAGAKCHVPLTWEGLFGDGNDDCYINTQTGYVRQNIVFCFPAGAKLLTESGTVVGIEEVHLGDSVQIIGASGASSFAAVHTISHADADRAITFCYATAAGRNLTAECDNFVPAINTWCTGSCDTYAESGLKTMRDLEVGDVLFTSIDGAATVTAAAVTAVGTVVLQGLYHLHANPRTAMLVVDGFVVSELVNLETATGGKALLHENAAVVGSEEFDALAVSLKSVFTTSSQMAEQVLAAVWSNETYNVSQVLESAPMAHEGLKAAIEASSGARPAGIGEIGDNVTTVLTPRAQMGLLRLSHLMYSMLGNTLKSRADAKLLISDWFFTSASKEDVKHLYLLGEAFAATTDDASSIHLTEQPPLNTSSLVSAVGATSIFHALNMLFEAGDFFSNASDTDWSLTEVLQRTGILAILSNRNVTVGEQEVEEPTGAGVRPPPSPPPQPMSPPSAPSPPSQPQPSQPPSSPPPSSPPALPPTTPPPSLPPTPPAPSPPPSPPPPSPAPSPPSPSPPPSPMLPDQVELPAVGFQFVSSQACEMGTPQDATPFINALADTIDKPSTQVFGTAQCGSLIVDLWVLTSSDAEATAVASAINSAVGTTTDAEAVFQVPVARVEAATPMVVSGFQPPSPPSLPPPPLPPLHMSCGCVLLFNGAASASEALCFKMENNRRVCRPANWEGTCRGLSDHVLCSADSVASAGSSGGSSECADSNTGKWTPRKCLRKVRKNKCRKKRVAVNCVQSCGLCIG